MKVLIVIAITAFLISCHSKECSFGTLESGIECACEFSERIKAVPGQTSDLQDEVKTYKDDFAAAVEAGTFTKESFTNKLKDECPTYIEIIK